jgi:hypothetical protein
MIDCYVAVEFSGQDSRRVPSFRATGARCTLLSAITGVAHMLNRSMLPNPKATSAAIAKSVISAARRCPAPQRCPASQVEMQINFGALPTTPPRRRPKSKPCAHALRGDDMKVVMTYRWLSETTADDDADDTVLPRPMPSSITSRKTLSDKPRASASSASRAQLDEDETLEAHSPLDEDESLEAHSPPQLDEDEDEQLEAQPPSDEDEDEDEPLDETEPWDEENPEVMEEALTEKVMNMKEALAERVCETPGNPMTVVEEQQWESTTEEDADIRPARPRGTKVRAGRKVQAARVLAEVQRLAREIGITTSDAIRGVMDADTGKGKGKGKHKDCNNSGKRGKGYKDKHGYGGNVKGKHGYGGKGGKHDMHVRGYWQYTGP